MGHAIYHSKAIVAELLFLWKFLAF